jgi:hypothetical protein
VKDDELEFNFPSPVGQHTIHLQKGWEKSVNKTWPIPADKVSDFQMKLERSEIHHMEKIGEFWVNAENLPPFICTQESVQKIIDAKGETIWETKEDANQMKLDLTK